MLSSGYFTLLLISVWGQPEHPSLHHLDAHPSALDVHAGLHEPPTQYGSSFALGFVQDHRVSAPTVTFHTAV